MEERRTLHIFRPGKAFPSVSVTGGRCDLMCGHCMGAHLKGMHPATTQGMLTEKALNVAAAGGTGMLISGGCDLRGKVPLSGFADAIAGIRGMGLTVNLHVGLISFQEARGLSADVISMDVHQDPEVIRNVLNLDAGPEAYSDAIDNVIRAGGRVVPHLTAGFGKADILLSAGMLREKGITEAVLLALVPVPGTSVQGPPPEDAVLEAVGILQDHGMEVTLGCMRHRGYAGLETRAIGMGVRRIANPRLGTVEWAEGNGYRVVEHRTCCCMPTSLPKDGRGPPPSCR